jgi:hypothetical protein
MMRAGDVIKPQRLPSFLSLINRLVSTRTGTHGCGTSEQHVFIA